MTYYRNNRARYSSAPLTPPADLVGKFVSWRPKDANGKRTAPRYATCLAYDADARTVTLEVQVTANPWTDPTGLRTVTIPLANGPFTVVG